MNATRTDHVDVSRGGRGIHVAVPSQQTGGAYSVVEAVVPAGQSGPPLHRHPASDETFVVLKGRLLVHLDGEVREVSAGDVVRVPRGHVHTFAGNPDEEVRFVAIHHPGGFEQFHVEAAEAAARAGKALDRSELMELARHHDWELVGPPMTASGVLIGQSIDATSAAATASQ
jgi:quercetin dioxygenase-like cupin family protein